MLLKQANILHNVNYLVAHFVAFVLSVLWVQVFHISEFIAPIINLLVSVPLNFIINKFWAFREKVSDRDDQSLLYSQKRE